MKFYTYKDIESIVDFHNKIYKGLIVKLKKDYSSVYNKNKKDFNKNQRNKFHKKIIFL
jgi:hypothetical protein